MSDRIRLDNYDAVSDAGKEDDPPPPPAPEPERREDAARPSELSPNSIPIEPAPEEAPVETTEAKEQREAREAQSRIDRLTREKYEAQRQRDEYAAMLAAQQRAQQYAAQQGQGQQGDQLEQARQQGLQQAREEAVAQRFNQDCNTLFERGQSEFGDMSDAVAALNAVGYGARPDALAALTRLPDGHRVYRELAGNLDNAARILQMEPMAMAMELARMSRGEAQGGNGAAPPVSRVPAPVRPVGGNAARAAKPLDKMSMAEFIRERDRTERRSRILR